MIKWECWRHLMVPRLWLCFIWCWDGSCWPKEFIHVCIICLIAQNKPGTPDIFYPFNMTWHKQKVAMCVWFLSCLIIIAGLSINRLNRESKRITQYFLKNCMCNKLSAHLNRCGLKHVAAKLWTHHFICFLLMIIILGLAAANEPPLNRKRKKMTWINNEQNYSNSAHHDLPPHGEQRALRWQS